LQWAWNHPFVCFGAVSEESIRRYIEDCQDMR